MRRYGHPKKFILSLAGIALACLCLPALRSNLYKAAPFLQKIGERLALFAVYSELPQESLGLLRRRFAGSVQQAPEAAQDSPGPGQASSRAPQDTPGGDTSGDASENSSGSDAAGEATENGSGSDAPAKASGDAASSEGASQAATPENTVQPPEIPAAYRGDMREEDLSGSDSPSYLKLEPGYLRNYTGFSHSEIEDILSSPPSFPVQAQGPQVLIYHTHATEAFERYDHIFYDTRNNWRSTDNNMNMVAVGDALAASLEAEGISVLHDCTQHDYPSYNGAYERSAETVNRYLEEYPSIQIILDVHRDAIDRGGTLIRPVTEIGGKKAAQLMVIAGCDDGTMDMPHWRENLRFAALIQQQAEEEWPGLMRPLFFGYRKYNQNLRPGALLLEFGSHGNTLEECVYTAQLVGPAIARAIRQLIP